MNTSVLSIMLTSSSILLAAGSLQAQSIPSQPSEAASNGKAASARPDVRHDEGRWFARIGTLGAMYHSGATIAPNGKTNPGASAQVSNNATLMFDIGYDVTKNFSVMLMGGVPVKPTITGKGAVASLGELGKVYYGPAILTGTYHFGKLGPIRPYAGTGVAYCIILKNYDAAVSHLVVNNSFGYVLQVGAEYQVNKKWEAFADVRQVWLSVDAHGLLSGGVPVTAHVKLNPTLISAGIKFHFNFGGAR